ncbi:hypothetical protein, partial [Candidatus Binatus sp.]|uniref:hypothetical protein n=1 Tax=Candidatus Binatus sp. TaxID=2811406 RepID=UPI003C6126CC
MNPFIILIKLIGDRVNKPERIHLFGRRSENGQESQDCETQRHAAAPPTTFREESKKPPRAKRKSRVKESPRFASRLVAIRPNGALKIHRSRRIIYGARRFYSRG